MNIQIANTEMTLNLVILTQCFQQRVRLCSLWLALLQNKEGFCIQQQAAL